jgi:hypothetical protein
LPNTEQIDNIYDVSGWLSPHINDIRSHSKPLHFKFKNTGHNSVEGYYKGKNDEPWISLKSTVLKRIPSGKPKLVSPDFDKIGIDRIENRLSQWACLFHDQVESTELMKWKEYVKHVKALCNNVVYRITFFYFA